MHRYSNFPFVHILFFISVPKKKHLSLVLYHPAILKDILFTVFYDFEISEQKMKEVDAKHLLFLWGERLQGSLDSN